MRAPQTPLIAKLDHCLGGSRLGEALMQYKAPTNTDHWILGEELLTHARSASNCLAAILEHQAIMTDEGGGMDIVDAWDTAGLADLVASLIECITLVSRRPCEAGEAED